MIKFKNPFKNNYQLVVKTLLFLLTVILIVILLPNERRYKYDYRLGKPWIYSDLIAPFDFAVLKPTERIEAEKKQILDQQKFYFQLDNTAMEKGIEDLNAEFAKIKNNIPHSARNYLQRWIKIYTQIMQQGIIEKIPELENKPENYTIYVINGHVATEQLMGNYYTILSASQMISYSLDVTNEIDMKFGRRLLEECLKQNVVFDKDLTDKTLEQQMALISTTSGAIQSGEKIITRGELVSEEKALILDSFKSTYIELFVSSSNNYRIIFGHFIIVLLTMGSLMYFLYRFQNNFFNNNRKLTMLLTIIVMMQAIIYLVYQFFGAEYLYIVPFCLAVVLITVFFGFYTAVFTHIVILINASMVMVNGYEFLFIQIIAGVMAAFSLIKLYKRSQMFSVIIVVFLVYLLMEIGLTLIEENRLSSLWETLMFYGFSAIFLAFAYPLIYLFEKIFKVITDLTLIEISDTNTRLLRELSLKAPGTFQHSNQVANLAEEAAIVLNANPLLVRAGAWYHDIGKVRNPLYFIENQTSDVNPHDDLSPEESSEIIIEHVIDGIEMARKNYIPESIIDFIRTHHGTRKTGYFYKKMQKLHPDEKIDDKIFSYHGPNPFSKETAILMMADSVEAASRSLPVKTEESIEKLVDDIIDGQLKDHQFDKTEITLNDITTVKKIFKKRLMNIYHVRISY